MENLIRRTASDLGLRCLPMSQKKNARLKWFNWVNKGNLSTHTCISTSMQHFDILSTAMAFYAQLKTNIFERPSIQKLYVLIHIVDNMLPSKFGKVYFSLPLSWKCNKIRTCSKWLSTKDARLEDKKKKKEKKRKK